MKKSLDWPSTMRMQVFLLSVVPVLALALFAVAVESLAERQQHRREWVSVTSGRLLALTEGVRQANSDVEREAALRAIALAGFEGELRAAPKGADISGEDQRLQLSEYLFDKLTEVTAPERDSRVVQPSSKIAVALDKSRLLVFSVPAPRTLPTYWADLAAAVFWVSLLTLPALGLSSYLSFLVTGPLTSFTQMARKASLDDEVSNLFVAGGSAELRSLAESFNLLRSRVKRIVEQRAQMLRAMGHDLRTPLTRLRMRIESCPDFELQRQMLLDIDTITGMVDDSMTYLKDMTADVGLAQKADLTSLLQTTVAGFADMGMSISFSGPSRLPITCKPQLLARAVSNLIDNASRYAENIEVVLSQDPSGEVTIAINDDGPGLAGDMKLKVMEPFFKADEARPVREHGGVGLGLAIAYGIAGRHGGAVSLHDNPPRGLSARLTIRSLDQLEQKTPAPS